MCNGLISKFLIVKIELLNFIKIKLSNVRTYVFIEIIVIVLIDSLTF